MLKRGNHTVFLCFRGVPEGGSGSLREVSTVRNKMDQGLKDRTGTFTWIEKSRIESSQSAPNPRGNNAI